jgi:hypothetical protein
MNMIMNGEMDVFSCMIRTLISTRFNTVTNLDEASESTHKIAFGFVSPMKYINVLRDWFGLTLKVSRGGQPW